MGIESKVSQVKDLFAYGPPPAVSERDLKPEEERFVYNVEVLGMSVKRASEMAGVPIAVANREQVIAARDHIRKTAAARANITKDDVLEGMKEAIEMARLQGDAMPMIAGWREIAKLLGYDQAIKIEVVRSDTVAGLRKQLQEMSEAKLIELAGGSELDGIIDADFYELDK